MNEMTKYKAIKGTKDILPDETWLWQEIERLSRAVFERFGYHEIRTPAIEETTLFTKSVGEDTDIVKKEMFSFVDRGERFLSLRPEGTAPIVRAYLENNLDKLEPFQKLYYIGPMFRAERPQAGRQRQFHQIGLEAIGSEMAALDAEAINVIIKILDSCNISGYKLKLNNLGCREDKKKLSTAIKDILTKKDAAKILCEDCARRLNTNPLRVLDCKNEHCRRIIRAGFESIDFLCGECRTHFDETLNFLKSLGIPYTIDPYIVRGLDYYTRTVFEVTHECLGSQDAVGAGGRYDNLISDMGGIQNGACGFALGVERMLMILDKTRTGPERTAGIDVFIATLGKTAHEKAFVLAEDARKQNLSCDIDFEKRSLKSQMRSADKLKAKFVVIIGDDEILKKEAAVRNMATKEQVNIKFSDLTAALKRMVG